MRRGGWSSRRNERYACAPFSAELMRLWGGVHWRADHDFGRIVGETVGKLVIEQLNRSGILPCPRVEVLRYAFAGYVQQPQEALQHR